MLSKLKTLEKNFLRAITAKQRDAATTALSGVSSALDKAAKGGVIHRANADRKKSRLALKLAALA